MKLLDAILIDVTIQLVGFSLGLDLYLQAAIACYLCFSR
ncbi:hypothetical protein VAE122_3400002 [Vibrio aestuarianus]|nr:hypothetical protein VAE122_3400002 [Vibrio aestuarianus]